MSQASSLERPGRVSRWLYGLHLWTLFGLALSNILLGLAILAAPAGVRWRRVDWRRLAPVLWPLGLYVLFFLTSVGASYEPAVSAGQVGRLFSLATLPLGLLLVRGERGARRVVDGVLVVAGLMAVYGLGQFLLGYGGLDQRIRGPFSHYMTFAGVLVLADFLLLPQFVEGKGRKDVWRWVAFAAVNLALLGSLTRSAWVAVALTVTVYLALRAPRLLLGYAPLFLVFVLLAPIPMLQRLFSIGDLQDVSNYDRLCMAEAGLEMISERPLFGLGPGLVEERYPLYRHPTAPRVTVPHLHNSFLQIAAEQGLLSLAAFLTLLGGSLAQAHRSYRREGRSAGPRADLWMGAVLGLLAFGLVALFEDSWGDTEVQRLTLFLVALPWCVGAGGPERDGRSPADAG